MTPRELEEYRALRATIRERGTTRIWVFLVGIVAWASLSVATAALAGVPVATLVPLAVLAASFEATFALHTGVERIGRYIQVFCETDDERPGIPNNKWEHTAMAFGRGVRGGAADPLFAAIFALATILNFIPVLLAEPVPVEVATMGAGHFALLVRIALAVRASKRQRAFELARFNEIKDHIV
jgi:hypothetical protein